MSWVHVVAAVAAAIVLAEALNKLERADPFRGRPGLRSLMVGLVWLCLPWRWKREHVITMLKVAGWSLMAVGAAGYLARLLLAVPWVVSDVAVIAGFATLIVRSRIKEG